MGQTNNFGDVDGVLIVGKKNRVKYKAAKSDKPKRVDDTSAEPHHRTTAGPSKVEFCRKLGDSWRDLADLVELPPYERARFARGDEAREIWEWLEQQDRWSELPGALRSINRPDLAELLEGQRS